MVMVIQSFPRLQALCHERLTRMIQSIRSESVVFFTPSDHIAVMNKAVLYIRTNEVGLEW